MKKTFLATLFLVSTSSALGQLEVDVSEIDYGTVFVGDVAGPVAITVTNTSETLFVALLEFSINGNKKGEYQLTTDCLNIIWPGVSCTAEVSLIPQHAGRKKRKLSIDGVTTDGQDPLDSTGVTVQLDGFASR